MKNKEKKSQIHSGITLPKSLLLTGMMGSGKTRVGSMLAEYYNVMFFDTDLMIKKKENLEIAEIFHEKGEEYFRQEEFALIQYLCLVEPGIISSGGGTFIQKNCKDLVKKYMISVYLQYHSDILWQRVKKSTHRPLIKQKNAKKHFETLLEERKTLYEEADIIIPLDKGKKNENFEIIKQYLSNYLHEKYTS